MQPQGWGNQHFRVPKTGDPAVVKLLFLYDSARFRPPKIRCYGGAFDATYAALQGGPRRSSLL